MAETRVVASLAAVDRTAWDALFPDCLETYDYLSAVEAAQLVGFRWRYVLAYEDGRLAAAAPVFLTEYALETTFAGPGRSLVAGLRRLVPAALILRLACIGSPCTETATIGFAAGITKERRAVLLNAMLSAFEVEAARATCGLLAIKDVPFADTPLWDRTAGRRGYRAIAGLPGAHIDIDFDTIDAYLARLSPGARKDMRRKLRAQSKVRVEVRGDLDGVLDRVMDLYQETRGRAKRQFEDLTAAYFTGVTERMADRAFYVLYYEGDDLLAVNLLLQDEQTLLDKFFCMEAVRGRPLNLYFLSWFTNISLCLQRGLTCYQSGQAGYPNKLRLGSQLTSTTMYFRHRNLMVNGVLQLIAPLFAADPTQRNAA